MATCYSILDRKIPWTEESGRLQSKVSKSWRQLSHWSTRTHSFMGLREEDHTGKVPFLSHQIEVTCDQHNLSFLMFMLVIWSN